jgi:uncharacterized protein (TIGR02996 family)
MTEGDAFWNAILAKREDNAARGMYADWLQERGDPYGEFMRVQLLIDEQRHAARGAVHRTLILREAQLWEEHNKRWIEQWRKILVRNIDFTLEKIAPDTSGPTCIVERGAPSRMLVKTATVSNIENVVEHFPIHVLRFDHPHFHAGWWSDLLVPDAPAHRMSAIDIHSGIEDPQRILFGHGRPEALRRTFSLQHLRIECSNPSSLSYSPAFILDQVPSLVSLALHRNFDSENEIGVMLMYARDRRPAHPNLQHLDLRRNTIRSFYPGIFRGESVLPHLRHLDLRDNPIPPKTAEDLTKIAADAGITVLTGKTPKKELNLWPPRGLRPISS